MKRFIMPIAIAIMAGNAAHACDMCGCGTGSQYIGLLPSFSKNFAGVQYTLGYFSGRYPSAYKGRPDELTHDYYSKLQLWGRHRIGKYYQVFAFVPYQNNVRVKDNVRTVNAGIGDIMLLLNRVLLSKEKGMWQHTVFGGVGVKLPTGKSPANNISDNQTIPAMLPGTGSWDIAVNANYTLQYRKAGANLDASGIITTPSADKYKYGSRYSAGLTGFYTLTAKNVRIMPQAVVRYEYATQDYYNYERKWLNEESGGHLLYGGAGMQATYKNYGLRLSYLLPLYQQYAAGQTTANYKLETGFFTLF